MRFIEEECFFRFERVGRLDIGPYTSVGPALLIDQPTTPFLILNLNASTYLILMHPHSILSLFLPAQLPPLLYMYAYAMLMYT